MAEPRAIASCSPDEPTPDSSDFWAAAGLLAGQMVGVEALSVTSDIVANGLRILSPCLLAGRTASHLCLLPHMSAMSKSCVNESLYALISLHAVEGCQSSSLLTQLSHSPCLMTCLTSANRRPISRILRAVAPTRSLICCAGFF